MREKNAAKSYFAKLKTVAIEELHPHPRNYRGHPEDQIAHLIQSIKQNGIYRNVIIAKDNTILAGHGVVLAAKQMGIAEIPVYFLDIEPDDTRALKILAGDNELGHLAEINDRMLTEILKEIKDIDIDGLLGTGYDEKMLANLVYVTRPESEIKDFNEAAEWVGMPSYEFGQDPLRLIVSFRNAEDRMKFARKVGFKLTEKTKSVWWPPKEEEDTPYHETVDLEFTAKKQ